MKKHVLLLATTLSIIFLNSLKGQTIELTFTGQDAETSEHVQLDSIFIRNITQEIDTFLTWNDTTLTLDLLTGIPEKIIPDNSFELLQNYPNPFNDRTTFVIRVFEKDNFIITLCDIIGRQLAQFSADFDQGAHLFTITASKNNFYLLNVVSSKKSQSIKLLNNNASSISQYRIDYMGFQPITVSNKIIKGLMLSDFPYTFGDEMQFVGFAHGYEMPAIYDSPTVSKTYIFKFEQPDTLVCGQTFIDKRDGKTYETVLIGDQCWMKENLNIGMRVNGIQNQQQNNLLEKYCWGDNGSNCLDYGGLYQWGELMQYDTNHFTQGICPKGWHLPNVDEWDILIESLGGSTVAGGNLKEGGSSGFNALMAGKRNTSGGFTGLTANTSFWTSVQQDEGFARLISLTQSSSAVNIGSDDKNNGYSVRCVKGLAPIINPDVVIIDTTEYELISDSIELDQGIYKYLIIGKAKADEIIIGDVIVGKTGEGYMRRVKNVDMQPPILLLETNHAALEDIFNQLEIVIPINIDSTTKYHPRVKDQERGGHFTIGVSDVQVILGPDANAIYSINCTYIPNDTLIMVIKDGVLQELTYGVGGTTETTKEFTISAGSGGYYNFSTPIIYWLQNYSVPVPGTPFEFGLDISLVLGFELDITGGVNVSHGTYSKVEDFYYTINYSYGHVSLGKMEGNKTDEIIEYNNEFTSDNSSIKISVGPEIALKLYHVVGPYAKLSGFGNFIERIGASPSFNKDKETIVGVDFEIGCDIGINIGPFSWTLTKFNFLDIGWDWSLWRLPEQVNMISGNNQTGNPGQPLSDPIIVKVTDNFGNSFPYIPVHFEVTQGGGSLSEYEVMTDEDGRVETNWTLGPQTGVNLMIASVQKAYGTHVINSPIQFSAMASFGLPVVTTAEVTDTTETTATCGGEVISDGDDPVTSRGVCWSTFPGPTINDAFTEDGSGLGTFVSYITELDSNTLYYVRAYATNTAGTAYGNQVEFTTLGISGGGMGEPCPGIPTVTYGGQVYNTVYIGSQCWLKENLNIGTRINGGQNQTDNAIIEKYCYSDLESNCDEYGGLYQWNEMMEYVTTPGAQGICPNGWHVPADEEWKVLEGTVDSQYGVGDPEWNDFEYRGYDAGMNLKSITGWSYNTGTDLFGFEMLPAGSVSPTGGFVGKGFQTDLWTSTENNSTLAYGRYLRSTSSQVRRYDYGGKTWAWSVRCLKD